MLEHLHNPHITWITGVFWSAAPSVINGVWSKLRLHFYPTILALHLTSPMCHLSITISNMSLVKAMFLSPYCPYGQSFCTYSRTLSKSREVWVGAVSSLCLIQRFTVCRGPQLVCLLGSSPEQWIGWVYGSRNGDMKNPSSQSSVTVYKICSQLLGLPCYQSLSISLCIWLSATMTPSPREGVFLSRPSSASVGLWDAMLSPSPWLISRDCLSLIKSLWGTLLTREKFRPAKKSWKRNWW